MIEESTPNLGATAKLGRLNELYRRLESLIATGLSIRAEDPELLEEHFSQPVQMTTLAIREGVKARVDRINARMDDVDTT